VKITAVKPQRHAATFGGYQQMPQARFEGASTSYRMGDKGLHVGNINDDSASSLSRLRKRSINAVRNNAHAASAAESFTSNLIGTGYTAKWPNADLQRLWDIWVEECDADGLDNFYALMELVGRTYFTMGEIFSQRVIRTSNAGLSGVPLKLRMVHPKQLDHTYTDRMNKIVQGIQHAASGERAKYHFWPSPVDDIELGFRVPVPASDVIHVFKRKEPGQVRGLPHLAAVLIRLYEIDEMQDATLVKAKVAQLFGWIVQRKTQTNELPQESSTLGEDNGETTEDGVPITSIRPGGVHYLDDDEEVTFSDPASIGDNYVEWVKSELRAFAAACNITHEQLTGDLSGVNYSSIRAGLIEMRRRISMDQYNLIIPRFCRQVAIWFAEAAVMSGAVNIPDFWTNKAAYLPKWRVPKWDHVDRVKEVTADLLEVRAGFESREAKVGERGNDIDIVNEELMRDALSALILDSIPSKTEKSGALQAILAAALAPQPDPENA